MALDDASQRYLASQGHGRLATVGPDGHPQNKPVGFHYNAELGTIDISGIDMEASAKYRNLGAHPDVAFLREGALRPGKRNGTWWLAAGQNTPLRPAPG
jgi:pyridoxamine 5'-phosphate oxidase family protein